MCTLNLVTRRHGRRLLFDLYSTWLSASSAVRMSHASTGYSCELAIIDRTSGITRVKAHSPDYQAIKISLRILGLILRN